MAKLEANNQGLIVMILEVSSYKVNWTKVELCTQKEKKHPKIFVQHFIQTFPRHTALNPGAPEHENLLIFAFLENFLPDKKGKFK